MTKSSSTFSLQLANLLVELGDQGLLGFVLVFLVNLKQHRVLLPPQLFSRHDLARMDGKLAGQLIHGPAPHFCHFMSGTLS
jgi:hypothetical protein